MDFKAALRQGSYSFSLKGETKAAIIEEMVALLVEDGKISDRDTVIQAVMEREKKMSTGLRHGVAIPHGKTSAVSDLVTAVSLKPEGVDFASADGQPSRIFVMTISSVLDTGPHMAYLAQISRLLNVPSVRERMVAATSREEILAILDPD